MNPLLDDLDIRVDERDLAINRLKSDYPNTVSYTHLRPVRLYGERGMLFFVRLSERAESLRRGSGGAFAAANRPWLAHV